MNASKKLHSHLPQEIIREIILLLPFESILTFKLVSKQWKNIINHPKFLNSYHNKSMAYIVHKSSLYLLLTRHRTSTVNGRLDHPFTVHRIPIGLDTVVYGKNINRLLSGLSDGVACVKTTNGNFLIYNPLTGASHRVDNAPLHQDSGAWMCYGFGYDRCADDYKIMVACTIHAIGWLKRENTVSYDVMSAVQNKNNSLFWVYSVQNRGWKSFDGFPYSAYAWRSTLSQGYSFNGALHWVHYKRVRPNQRTVIVTYDLHTSRFGETCVPDARYTSSLSLLTELNGRLGYGYNDDNERFDVWVMEEYGVGGSWTKLFSISYRQHMRFDTIIRSSVHTLYDLKFTTLCEYDNGRKVVLFVCKQYPRLTWYDIDKNEMWTSRDITGKQTIRKKGRRTMEARGLVARG